MTVGDWCREVATNRWDGGQLVRLTSGGDVILVAEAALAVNTVDVAVARYTPDGNLVWYVVLDSTPDDFVQGMALDSHDNVFVIGQANSLDGNDSGVFVAEISAQGQVLWSHSPLSYDRSRPGGIAADADGNAVLTRSGVVEKYSPSGALLWSTVLNTDGGAGAVAVDAAGAIFVGGLVTPGTVTKLSAAGSPIWSKVVGGTEAFPMHMVFAPGGDLVILSEAPNPIWAIGRYSSNGALVWSDTLDRTMLYTVTDLALDGSGNIFVAGMANDFGKPGYDTYLAEYGPDGSSVWGKELGFRGGLSVDIAVSPDDKLFVAGSDPDTNSAFLVRLTP